jgi:hypothetical protein
MASSIVSQSVFSTRWGGANAAGLYSDQALGAAHQQETVLVKTCRNARAGLRAVHFDLPVAHPGGSLLNAPWNRLNRGQIEQPERFTLQRF